MADNEETLFPSMESTEELFARIKALEADLATRDKAIGVVVDKAHKMLELMAIQERWLAKLTKLETILFKAIEKLVADLEAELKK